MTIRPAAHLLIVVMLAASGRLLMCGWECSDEVAAPAEASCHQESAPAAAINADGMHACLPEVAEPRVTVAKPASAQLLLALPLVAQALLAIPADYTAARRVISDRSQFESPHSRAPFILRI